MRPSTTALATLAALTLSPALASAGDPGALLKYAPRDSGMIAGFDGEASRGTASFKEGFKLLKRDAGFRKVARTLKKELNFDVARDLDTGLIATPKVKGTGKRASRTFTLVVSGSIDRAATEAALAKNGKPSTISGVSVFKTTKGATVSFLDDSTMVVVAGGDDYTARAWSTVAGKTKGADSGADLAAELSSVDTSRNAWMVADASKVRQPPGANVERLALTVSFAGGLSVDSALQMGSAGQAAKAATADRGERQALPHRALVRAVDVMAADLTPGVYDCLLALQGREDAAGARAGQKRPRGGAGGGRRAGKLVPQLVYELEESERRLLALSSACGFNLLRNAKRSVARDFKLDGRRRALMPQAGGGQA